jgi:predicted short-subunit dehydrogenase-like oxidoreductase (DUF2520 family)
MKVSIIGSGNVATHLARALKRAGVKLVHVWSQHLENAQALAHELNAAATTNILDLSEQSDVIFIAVKDDAISDIAFQLKDYQGIVAHTAGSVALSTIAAVSHPGVFYPLQTFSKHKDLDFSTVPLCLEAANASTLETLKQLAQLISKNVYEVDSEQRKTLHLAAVFACNFPNYLYHIAQQLLAEQQLDFDIIRPLIAETANKVQTAIPMEVQTGPAIRNDEQTLTKHEGLLQDKPEWLSIYKLLSDQIKISRL